MILEGTYLDVPFGKLDSVGAHPHRQRHVVGRIDRGLERVCRGKNVKESWIYGSGEEDGWSRYRYDAKTKSFEVSLFRPGGTRNFKLNLNPKFEPKNMETGGPESKWLTDEQLASRTKSTSPPLPRLPRTRIKALVGEVVGIAGIASVAGEVIKDLHEGHPGRAAVTAGVATGLGYAFKRYPPAMVFTAAAATIMAYDDTVKTQANAAGEALDDYLGFSDHTVIGGLNASAYAVEKSIYNGVIKPIGPVSARAAACPYIRLTSDEYTLNPFKAEWFPW